MCVCVCVWERTHETCTKQDNTLRSKNAVSTEQEMEAEGEGEGEREGKRRREREGWAVEDCSDANIH